MSNPNPVHKFKKGEVTNPEGRPPKEWTWRGLLKDALEETPEGDKRQYKKLVAESLRLKALEGDVVAIKEFGNRIDGMPKQDIGLGNAADGPLKIVIEKEQMLEDQDE